MRRGLAAALLCLLLAGCSWLGMMTAPALYAWRAEVMGMSVEYKLVEPVDGQWGAASWWAGTCTIALAHHLSGTKLVWVAAHEIGHCVDGAYLNWSHNGWTNEGCFHFGSSYCDPKEAYAQAYADAYVLRCGFAYSPLGLRPGDGVVCDLPDPWTIDPRGWY